MATYKVGQMVLLRSGKSGEIKRVLIDHPEPHLTRYQVAMEPSGQLIGINGIDVMQTLLQPKPHLIGKTLDGYKLTGITYGADRTCQVCHGSLSQHEVFETELSRAAAMEVLAALMAVTDPDAENAN